jgi:hypothetical protein
MYEQANNTLIYKRAQFQGLLDNEERKHEVALQKKDALQRYHSVLIEKK